jgi:hypothetical protein
MKGFDQMQRDPSRELKGYNRLQNTKAERTSQRKNRIQKGLQLTKEYQSAEMMNTPSRQIRQDSKAWNPLQWPKSRDGGKDSNIS